MARHIPPLPLIPHTKTSNFIGSCPSERLTHVWLFVVLLLGLACPHKVPCFKPRWEIHIRTSHYYTDWSSTARTGNYCGRISNPILTSLECSYARRICTFGVPSHKLCQRESKDLQSLNSDRPRARATHPPLSYSDVNIQFEPSASVRRFPYSRATVALSFVKLKICH